MDLGQIGIWSAPLRTADASESRDAAVELEALGYGALWFPGGAERDIFPAARGLLEATSHVVVATGILNIWAYEPERCAAEHVATGKAYPDRFLLGLGVGHAPTVQSVLGRDYTRPYSAMVEFLDGLDAASPPVPVPERCLAALGPKMLDLARDRSLGAHPYLVDPAHTAVARDALGAGPLLAPEQMVVLESDPALARAVARETLGRYLALPNYTNNFRRLGFGDDDLTDGGSDRLVDTIIAWGDEEQIAARVREHLAAGADHVCVQVLSAEGSPNFPYEAWRRLAGALGVG
jgi:probable F420-dependent oxidoreductase